MGLLAHRLMRLIESHADELAETLEAQIASSERCATYAGVSSEEMKGMVAGVYANLGHWLVTKTEQDIERAYMTVGTRRAEQNVPASQLVWCIVLVKENVWDYLKDMEGISNPSEVFAVLELMRMVEQFFDRALYYAVRGHEQVREAQLGELKK
jgi:hypothetical protein